MPPSDETQRRKPSDRRGNDRRQNDRRSGPRRQEEVLKPDSTGTNTIKTR
jgi:hypothetical protein